MERTIFNKFHFHTFFQPKHCTTLPYSFLVLWFPEHMSHSYLPPPIYRISFNTNFKKRWTEAKLLFKSFYKSSMCFPPILKRCINHSISRYNFFRSLYQFPPCNIIFQRYPHFIFKNPRKIKRRISCLTSNSCRRQLFFNIAHRYNQKSGSLSHPY